MGETNAQADDRSQVGDEAGGQDHLAELRLVEPRLDHHRVDDGDGGRGERDAANQRRGPVPASKQVPGNQRSADEGAGETRQPDGNGLLEALAQHRGLDLGPGQERQQDAAEAGQEQEPRADFEGPVEVEDPVLIQEQGQVASGDTDQNLNQRDALPEADGDDRGQEGQPEPDGGDAEVGGHVFPPGCGRKNKKTLVRGLPTRVPTRKPLLGTIPGRSHQPLVAAVRRELHHATSFEC